MAETLSGDVVWLAGHRAAKRLQQLGMPEEEAKVLLLELLKSIKRPPNPMDSMMPEMPDFE